MKLSAMFFVCLAALAAALLAAPAAQAFTYQSASGYSADGSSNLVDPDARFDSLSKGGSSMSLPGGGTVQFGNPNSMGSYEQDYQKSVNHMFNPLGSPGN
jgi:hypothetical protein